MTKYSYNFLYQLSRQKHRTVYVRLIALDLQDNVQDILEGIVSAGSISLNNKSITRRSINLTANISNAKEVKKYLWAIKTKCKIEIGLNNNINTNYDDIIWFSQGIFILTSFSSSFSSNQIQTINLQGRDKMCLLDGTLGGTLPAGGTFDSYDFKDIDGTHTKNIKYPVKDIIKDLVHQFGNEPFHNIFIYDLDIQGLELLEYKQSNPLYMWRKTGENIYSNGTENGQQPCYKNNETTSTPINALQYESLFQLQNDLVVDTIKFSTASSANEYICSKIEYGNPAGYKLIDLIYPDILEAKSGESITSLLDKIINNLLVNYEYFYDIEGHFIFQKVKAYEVEEFSSIKTDSDGQRYSISLIDAHQEEIAYTFEDFELITGFSENPNIGNLKNDFTVWGERSGVDGDNIPIHMRYAIDHYPVQYTTINVTPDDLIEYNRKYGTAVLPQTSTTFIASDEFIVSGEERSRYLDDDSSIVDPTIYLHTTYYVNWREVLWQMQADYRRYGHLNNFEQKIIEANGSRYPNGKTGYEQYYMDIEGFLHNEIYKTSLWSEILSAYNLSRKLDHCEEIVRGITCAEIKQDLEDLNTIESSNNNFAQSRDEWKTAWDAIYQDLDTIDSAQLPAKAKFLYNFYWHLDNDNASDPLVFWSKKVFEAPNQLNFWIDFMSGDSKLMEDVGVPSIKSRPKVETNNRVKTIDYAVPPNIIYCEDGIPESQYRRSGYSYFNVGNKIDKMFARATQGLSAKEAIQDMVYNYAQTAEAVSINCIPIYHLEPNTKIHIDSDEYDIHDDYVIQSMTIPLAYNGTMSISATKARKRIF